MVVHPRRVEREDTYHHHLLYSLAFPTNEEEEEEEEEEDGYDPVTCVLSQWIATSSDRFFFCNFDSGTSLSFCP